MSDNKVVENSSTDKSPPAKKGRLKRWLSGGSKTEAAETDLLVNEGEATAAQQAESGNNKQEDLKTAENLSSAPATVDEGLAPSRNGLLAKIGQVFKGSFDLNDELFDELEELLIASDIGVTTSINLIDKLKQRVSNDKIQTAAGVVEALKLSMADILAAAQTPWIMPEQPHVVLVVGVNGVGKTTTTAKIAHHFQLQGKKVMLAAADTFRAAAVEQLQEWGTRLDIPVISQGHGADAAAVAHDSLMAARARNIDILLIDTAGRLHTQSNLMEQLEKVTRVIKKIDPSSPHEVLQVIDAGTGQNAVSQIEQFQKTTQVTSVCITKLDGSAKGGVALAVAGSVGIPIRFIGVGEGIADLKPFNALEYAQALVGDH